MADIFKANLTTILTSTGLAVASLSIGYFFGSRKAIPESIFKSYSNEKDPLAAYINESSLREPQYLKDIREETKARTGDDFIMLVDPLEAQFIRLLVKSIEAKRCIEIGTFTGYNACSVALALPDDGEVIACDISDDFIKIGQPFWSEDCAKKINVKIAPAIETLDCLIEEGQEGKFDLVFIDADKPNYGRYYERALVLLRKGGFIVVDNTLWSGRVLGNESEFDEKTRSIFQLNKKIQNDGRVDVSMLMLGDGTTLCRKN